MTRKTLLCVFITILATAIGVMRNLGNTVGGLPFTLFVDAKSALQKTDIGALDFAVLLTDIAEGPAAVK